MNRRRLFAVMAILSLGLNSCNIFDPLDNPSGDAQTLSAARACFDQGDYACAAEMYGKLAGNEVAVAESTYVTLDQNGVGIAAFARALATENVAVGTLINELVKAAAPGAGQTKRAALLAAYKKVDQIQTRTLRGFVRFTTAMALAAEVWSEDALVQADYILNAADVVNVVATCRSAGACDASCAPPGATSMGVLTGATDFTTSPSTVTLSGATPQLDWFAGALNAALTGLTEMSATTGNSLTLLNTLSAQTGAGDDCYRGAMLSLGVGQ